MAEILVAGASGALGTALVTELLRRGHRVRGLTRRAGSLGGRAPEVIGDALVPDSLRGACDGVEVVISALGAPVTPSMAAPRETFSAIDTPANLNLLAEAERAGVRRFVYVSVACHEVLGHLDYVAAHEAVVAALGRSRLSHAIVRPTGFYSAFAAFLPLAAKGAVPLLGRPSTRTNPIDDRDLAALLADAAEGDESTAITAGGPDVLSRGDIAALACVAQGLPPRSRALPAWVARLMAWCVAPFHPRMASLMRFYAALGEHDCVAEARGRRTLEAYFREQVEASRRA